MAVKFSNQATHFYKKAQSPLQADIKTAVARVVEDPLCGKPLHGQLTGTRRIKFSSKVTGQRLVMVYELRGGDVIVLRIDFRDRVYRRLFR
jgi:mRNA-degrading endonuclease RelE of RelBE toxin-antitoxin system